MRRRTFLAALPATALAQSRAENPNRERPDVHGGDRIDGATEMRKDGVALAY